MSMTKELFEKKGKKNGSRVGALAFLGLLVVGMFVRLITDSGPSTSTETAAEPTPPRITLNYDPVFMQVIAETAKMRCPNVDVEHADAVIRREYAKATEGKSIEDLRAARYRWQRYSKELWVDPTFIDYDCKHWAKK